MIDVVDTRCRDRCYTHVVGYCTSCGGYAIQSWGIMLTW